jgi:hypothetical protein
MAHFQISGGEPVRMNDARLIAALLSKRNLRTAARAAGFSLRTAQRRIADPDFQQQFRDAKMALIHEATTRVAANAAKAADVLCQIFSSKKSKPSSRVSAAAVTLRIAIEVHTVEEIERRLAILEKLGGANALQLN